MRYLLPGCLLWVLACESVPISTLESADGTGFRIDIVDELKASVLLADGVAYCSDCTLTFGEAAGRPAWELTSQVEFSDAYFDLEALFGRTFDLTQPRFLSYEVFVPDSSYITTLNHNFQHPDGSTGGCGQPANNFLHHRGAWQHVLVDLTAQRERGCGRWHGESDPLPAVARLSINPYNANLHTPSSIYFNNLQLHPSRPDGDFLPTRTVHRDTTNAPFLIDFEDEEYLRQAMAFRAFEAKNHALAHGKYGNTGRALGNHSYADQLSFWLIKMQYYTGAPVDMTSVDSLYLRYYLSPKSDPIDHTELFLVSGHDWDNILYDTLLDYTWQPGQWTRVAFALDDFNFDQVRGTDPVLPAATEFRFDFKPQGGKGEIEIWLDEVGWK